MSWFFVLFLGLLVFLHFKGGWFENFKYGPKIKWLLEVSLGVLLILNAGFLQHIGSYTNCAMLSGYERDKCYWNRAEDTLNTTLCERITTSETTKKNCYFDIYEKADNIEICQKIKDISEREMLLTHIHISRISRRM
ncbi:MAG: hypothetical protein GF334_00530 [Candidatus Altiarchaeales archaeon]|nr:hypothetical protein [Candidatus Altiarchaeales archaeon]